jgi:hypothetical protein
VRRWFRVLELGFATGQCQPLLDQVREDLPSLDGRPEERLHIDPELGVTETALAQPDSAYGFRYEGLKLLLRADSRYFLVPASCRPTAGPCFSRSRNRCVSSSCAPTSAGATRRRQRG